MLTIFACPKSFTDPHIAIIQRNAITSWTLLEPRPEIILFGGEPYEFGIAEICQELGLRHVPEVARNEYGTPLINDIFEKAYQSATFNLLCYTNADIILLPNLVEIISFIRESFQHCLIVASPINCEISCHIDFQDVSWRWSIGDALARNFPRKGGARGADVFIFDRSVYRHAYHCMPPFAIGRFYCEFWLIGAAVKSKFPVVDISYCKVALHQNHPGSSHAGPSLTISPLLQNEIERNKLLFQSKFFLYRYDTPYYLEPNSKDGYVLKPRHRFPSLWVCWKLLQRNVIIPLWRGFLTRTYTWRHALGLYRWWKKAKKSPSSRP